jgi:F-type H+-transporting ATPase subunit a
MFALEVPPTSHLFNWPILFGGDGWFGVNKVVLIFWLALVVTLGFFLLARKGSLVPTGVQNLAEVTVEFIENGIILQTMGPEGLPFAPFLLTIFSFTLVINLLGLLPFIQMPANSRIALPMFMAVVVWLVYNFMGIAKNGIGGYLKHILLPPGVPMALKPLMAIINFISDIFVRPFALMVRLFANMFAGHLIIVSFGALCVALFEATKVGALLPYPLLVALTGFELLVAFLQAYIFTILAAVFTSLAMGHGGDHDHESEHH